MPIISISLNDKICSDLDKIQSSFGFSGRSELIRTAIRSFIQEQNQSLTEHDTVEGILLVAHLNKDVKEASDAAHNYTEIIKTHLHHHLESGKCLHLFIIKGNIEIVKSFVSELQASSKTDYIKLFIP